MELSIPAPQILLGAVAPEMILILAAVAVLMLEVFSGRKEAERLAWLTLAGIVAAGWATLRLSGLHFTTFSGMYAVDAFSTFLKLTLLLGAGMAVLISERYLKDEGIEGGEFYALLLFATTGMFVMVSGADLMTIFLGLETMSVSLYAMAGYARKRVASNEAAMKYFILGSLASAFLLYGMSLLYGASGSTNLAKIAAALIQSRENIHLAIIGGALLLAGLFFKIAAVPFHMWTPDVYQGAPTPVTAFMSAGPKAAALGALIRILAGSMSTLYDQWWILLWIVAALTMTVGNLIAATQDNIKRMLAYSSIAHAGYLLLGVLAGGDSGSSAVLFYLLIYTFMNVGAFAVVAIVGGKGEERSAVADFSGLGYRHPLLGASMVIILFSLAGIPPLAGFWGKYYLFFAALDQGYVWLAVIAALNSVVAVFYYLRVIVMMYMKDGAAEPHGPIPALPASMVAAVVLAVYGSLLVGLFPGGYLAMAAASALAH